jgi:hypothetical protein
MYPPLNALLCRLIAFPLLPAYTACIIAQQIVLRHNTVMRKTE